MNDDRATGRRTFLALGVGVILVGCTQTDNGGNSNDSVTRENRGTISGTTVMPGPSRTDSSTGSERTTTATAPSASTTRQDPTNGPTGGELIEIDSERNEPQTTVTIESESSGDGSTRIVVWNDAEVARGIAVRVRERSGGRSLFEETYRLESDAYVRIDSSMAGAYFLDVGVAGESSERIELRTDTCNDYSVLVAVRRDGAVDSTEIGTEMLCALGTIQTTN